MHHSMTFNWKDLNAYSITDPKVAGAIIAKQRQFWYLTEAIAPFSLFSDSVLESEKCQIARALQKLAQCGTIGSRVT